MNLPIRTLSWLVLVGLLVACSGGSGGGTSGGSSGSGSGSSSGSGSGSSSGGGGGGGGGGSSSSTGGAGGGGPFCPSPAASLPFDRTCAASADCALKLHMIDCCGSLAAVGINTSDAAAFDAEEMTCQALCDCLSKPTVADDGKTSNDNAAFQVSCVGGKCVTSVP